MMHAVCLGLRFKRSLLTDWGVDTEEDDAGWGEVYCLRVSGTGLVFDIGIGVGGLEKIYRVFTYVVGFVSWFLFFFWRLSCVFLRISVLRVEYYEFWVLP